MSTRYKEKEYLYLKLLESRREGGKVKHLQLVNLSGILHMQPDRIAPLIEDLNKTLVFYRGISNLGPPWCRFFKISYILALENSFKVERHCHEQDLRELLLAEGKRKQHKIFIEDAFNELILNESLQWGEPGDYTVWIEKESLLLLNERGFPLRSLSLSCKSSKEAATFLESLAIRDKKPIFFLGYSCELLYNIFRHLARLKKKSESCIREVFLFRQKNGGSGELPTGLDKVLTLVTATGEADQRVKKAMASVINLKYHEEFVLRRLKPLTADMAATEKEISCTYFISSLFKSIFDYLKNKHNA